MVNRHSADAQPACNCEENDGCAGNEDTHR